MPAAVAALPLGRRPDDDARLRCTSTPRKTVHGPPSMAMADDWFAVTGMSSAIAFGGSLLSGGAYGGGSDGVIAMRATTTLRVVTTAVGW